MRGVMAQGRNTGAPVWQYDADYMPFTPTFREGSPCFVVLFIEGRKANGRLAERERGPRVCGCIILLSRTDMLLYEDRVSFGRMDFILRYFRRLFITVVSYCRARQRSVKMGPGFCFFLQGEKIDRYNRNYRYSNHLRSVTANHKTYTVDNIYVTI